MTKPDILYRCLELFSRSPVHNTPTVRDMYDEIVRLREFVAWVIRSECWDDGGLDGGEIQDKAVEMGMLREERYDRSVHGDNDVGVEAGEPWFVLTWSKKP